MYGDPEPDSAERLKEVWVLRTDDDSPIILGIYPTEQLVMEAMDRSLSTAGSVQFSGPNMIIGSRNAKKLVAIKYTLPWEAR